MRSFLPKAAIMAACVLAAGAGCSKKSPVAPVAPVPVSTAPERAPAPSAILSVDPPRILRGERAVLKWSAQNADSAEIAPGLGEVSLEGDREVDPREDTTYTLTVRGPGGESSATARVIVTEPRPELTRSEPLPRPDDRARFDRIEDGLAQIRDILFDYDDDSVRLDQRPVLDQNARLLGELFSQFPQGAVIVEGHCDERGSSEYNLALGDRRARSVHEYLLGVGLPRDRLRVVSFGKERPICTEANERCWTRNRRATFTPAP
jgi:peptidoglycan-associated lipoprotein